MNHSSAVSWTGGEAFLWGRNNDGELCDGTLISRSESKIALPRGQKVLPGTSFTVGLNGSSVWSCGNNDYGQLGTGNTYSTAPPVQVLQLSYITDIAAGTSFAVAVKRDGTVWAWGRNNAGQLGIDSGRLPTRALVNLGPQEVRLAVAISGSGAGSVNSNPAGIACSGGTCSRVFTYRTAVTLHASPAAGSTLAWGGACSGTGPDCHLSLTSDTSVSASFFGGDPVRIGSTGHNSLAAAYASAPTDALIMAAEGDLPEGLLAERSVAVKIVGGYDANFTGRSLSPMRLRGTILLRQGTLRVDRIAVL